MRLATTLTATSRQNLRVTAISIGVAHNASVYRQLLDDERPASAVHPSPAFIRVHQLLGHLAGFIFGRSGPPFSFAFRPTLSRFNCPCLGFVVDLDVSPSE